MTTTKQDRKSGDVVRITHELASLMARIQDIGYALPVPPIDLEPHQFDTVCHRVAANLFDANGNRAEPWVHARQQHPHIAVAVHSLLYSWYQLLCAVYKPQDWDCVDSRAARVTDEIATVAVATRIACLVHMDGDRLMCRCGNTPEAGGFESCNATRAAQDPSPGWAGLYRCNDCFRLVTTAGYIFK